MGYYNDSGAWVDADPPPPAPARRRMPREMPPLEERLRDPNEGIRRQARLEQRSDRYDDDGNLVRGAPANTGETANDVARSGATGVHQGIAAIPGIPGDSQELGAQLGGVGHYWFLRATGRSDEEARADVQRTLDAARTMRRMHGGYMPTSHDINEAVLSVESPEVREWTDHTPETTAGEYARTIGQFAPAALLPGGVATRVTRVVAPAVASETAGQLTEGTPAEPWARLIAGVSASGVTEGFLRVLSRNQLTPDQRGVRLILRELEDQGQTPDDIVRQANSLLRQAPTEEVLAETLGPGGLRLARAVAAMGRGGGRSVADEALTVRAEGGRIANPTAASPSQTRAVTSTRDRFMDEATRMTAPAQTRAPRNYDDALDALKTARSGQGAEAYRTAYAATPDPEAVQTHLMPYMAEAPRAAFQSAERQLGSAADALRARLAAATQRGAAAAETDPLRAELDDILTARNQIAAVGDGRPPNGLNPRAIDYFGRGLSQMESVAGMGSPEARALGEARRAYHQMADQIVPELGQARTHYGASMRIEELMGQGRRVFEMSDGEIDRLLRGANGRGLSLEEFDGFTVGVLDAIERKLGMSDTAFLARLMRNQNWRDQLETAVGGEAQARRFFDRLAREANMQNTRNYVQRGSQTTPIAEDIAALTAGESEFAFMSDNARQLIASGGNVRPLVTRWVLGVYDRFNRPGLRDPAVQEALARRLFTRVTRNSSRELRDALNAVRSDPSVPEATRRWLERGLVAAASTTDERIEGEGPSEGSLADDYLNARREVERGAAPVQ